MALVIFLWLQYCVHRRCLYVCFGKDLGATAYGTKEGDMGVERRVDWWIRCMCLLGLIAFLSVGFMGCASGRPAAMTLDQWQADDESTESDMGN
jgi:hypothetical protein